MATGCHWDRIADSILCADCEEDLVRGEGEPLVLRTRPTFCAICGRQGTVEYTTWPLRESEQLQMELCPHHLRSLLARRLTSSAYHVVRRQLNLLGLAVEQLFLMHEAFYDEAGSALQPVPDE